MELSGTSMATPLVSGTAALVLSIIGQMTGNYTGQGAVLKKILLEAADKSTGAPPRVNARSAVEAALKQFAPLGLVTVSPRPASPGTASVTLPALTERYYQGIAANAWQGVPLETSIRGASLPLTAFKYGMNVTVRFTTTTYFNATGEYFMVHEVPRTLHRRHCQGIHLSNLPVCWHCLGCRRAC